MAQNHDATPSELTRIARQLQAAFDADELEAFGALLADDVHWGDEDAPNACRTRADVMRRLARMRANGRQTRVLEVVPGNGSILVGFSISNPSGDAARQQRTVFQVMSVSHGRISAIRGFPSRIEAAEDAGLMDRSARMRVESVIPILNVSSIIQSFAWFEQFGWIRKWDWSAEGGEPTFGAVGSDAMEIQLCRDGQGGRGQSGMWLAIWIDDVDAVYARCLREELEVLRPPQDEPWGVRELHVRHPDGHVFRVSQPSQHHH